MEAGGWVVVVGWVEAGGVVWVCVVGAWLVAAAPTSVTFLRGAQLKTPPREINTMMMGIRQGLISSHLCNDQASAGAFPKPMKQVGCAARS